MATKIVKRGSCQMIGVYAMSLYWKGNALMHGQLVLGFVYAQALDGLYAVYATPGVYVLQTEFRTMDAAKQELERAGLAWADLYGKGMPHVYGF